MSDKCPECGADYLGPAYIFNKPKGRRWKCGTSERRTEDYVLDGLFLGEQCLRNQLATAQAQLECCAALAEQLKTEWEETRNDFAADLSNPVNAAWWDAASTLVVDLEQILEAAQPQSDE